MNQDLLRRGYRAEIATHREETRRELTDVAAAVDTLCRQVDAGETPRAADLRRLTTAAAAASARGNAWVALARVAFLAEIDNV